ncbi:MAG: PEP-CTERM sorting domain-containing protein, partial [Planctomycetota bacterium]|nr:PEP-CTERM sorting domain-containing protein [Planctomycetota bacterium]
NYEQGGGFAWEHADFTGDGIVDVSDLSILATVYGNGCFVTTSQSVPEPTILTLLVMGAVGLLAYPRRKRK